MTSTTAAGASPPVVPTLTALRVELLRDCPLHCRHCSAYAAPGHPWLLAPERVERLVDEFVELGGQEITFTGGEPLLYPELRALVQHCAAQQLRVRLFSSGVVACADQPQPVSLATLQELAPFVAGIDYSVYAAEARYHDQLTGVRGSLSATIEAIRRTRAARIGAVMHFVPTSSNYRELPALVALAAALGVARVGILRFVPQGRGKQSASSLALDPSAHTWLRHTIIELQAQYPSVQINVGSAYNLLGVKPPKPCRAGIDQLVVFADGSIAPCSAFAHVVEHDTAGNILAHSLREVWTESLYLKQVRAALAVQPTCSGCLAQKTLQAGRIDPFAQDPLLLLAPATPHALSVGGGTHGGR